MNLATAPPKLYGKLISTTDIKLASKLNRKISLKGIVQRFPSYFERTDEGTLVVYAGRELYELEDL